MAGSVVDGRMNASFAATAKLKGRSSDCFVRGETIMRLQSLRPRVAEINISNAKTPPKVADTFYSSAAWIALRDLVRREAGGRCQVPGCGRADRWTIVDHIVELKDGGAPLDRSNLILLCRSHHSLKTAAERAKRTARRPGGL
ncbi:MAG: HNH endonuclease signature motif containing protein [Reyranellaceae bacterium]